MTQFDFTADYNTGAFQQYMYYTKAEALQRAKKYGLKIGADWFSFTTHRGKNRGTVYFERKGTRWYSY